MVLETRSTSSTKALVLHSSNTRRCIVTSNQHRILKSCFLLESNHQVLYESQEKDRNKKEGKKVRQYLDHRLSLQQETTISYKMIEVLSVRLKSKRC